jgi:hypothetical protein
MTLMYFNEISGYAHKFQAKRHWDSHSKSVFGRLVFYDKFYLLICIGNFSNFYYIWQIHFQKLLCQLSNKCTCHRKNWQSTKICSPVWVNKDNLEKYFEYMHAVGQRYIVVILNNNRKQKTCHTCCTYTREIDLMHNRHKA